jgi:hypothetical protein
VPADHKVSVGWQIVATFIIIANFWAFYRIRKLRKYLLYVGLPSYLFAGALFYVSYVGLWVSWLPDGSSGGFDMTDTVPAVWGIVPPVFITIQLIGWGLQGFAVYLVIIWSRQHNRAFETPPESS